jgi:hypothetical protein
LTPGEERALGPCTVTGFLTVPEVLGEEHGAQAEAVDDYRVRYRAVALAAARVRLIACR